MLINLVQFKLQSRTQDMLASADIEINGDRPGDLQVHNTDLYQRVLRQGLLGLGESYMQGWWDCPKLDEFFAKILRGENNCHCRPAAKAPPTDRGFRQSGI